MKQISHKISRREFLRRVAALAAMASLGACGKLPAPVKLPSQTPTHAPPTPGITPTVTPNRTAPRCRVAVIGGGIAGLSAAYFLGAEDVVVLEAQALPGGRTASGVFNGFSYAKGTEYLGKPEGALAQIIQELQLQALEIPEPMDAQYRAGKFYFGDEIALYDIQNSSLEDYNRYMETVTSYAEQISNLPDFDPQAEVARLDEMTLRQFFDEMKFAKVFYEPANVAMRGLFGASMDEVSALCALQELAFDFEGEQALESTDELDIPALQSAHGSGSYTFRTGIFEVVAALTTHLGNRLRLNAEVLRVTHAEQGYQVIYRQPGAGEQSLTAEVVILAIPAPLALAVGSAVLSAEQKDIMAQIPYAAYATVAMFSDTPIFERAFDLALPDKFFMTDLYDSAWVQRFYDLTLKQQKTGILCAYIAPQSYLDRSLLQLLDENLMAQVYTDLDRVFPGASARISGYDLMRFPYAYPVMVPGAYQRLARLHELTQGSLLLAGDYLIYPTFEAAVESGLIAAEKAQRIL